VEDDPDFRQSVRAVLEASGYIMIEAANGEEGLKAFRVSKPDLIIVDLMMEEVDSGAALMKELRAAGCAVPVYMLSSAGDSLTMSIDYTQLGFSGVLQKPLDFDRLLILLKSKLQ
jgi:DNA-binding response OmpR family regulator